MEKEKNLQKIIEGYHRYHDSFPIEESIMNIEYYSRLDGTEKNRETKIAIHLPLTVFNLID